MKAVSLYEAKIHLNKYVDLIEGNKESIVIMKNGKPVVEIIPFRNNEKRKIGMAKGLWRDVSEQEFNDFDMQTIMQGSKY